MENEKKCCNVNGVNVTISGIKDLVKDRCCYKPWSCYGPEHDCFLIGKHERRFTREVFPDFYHPTAYNMHGCNPHEYHVHPANVCNYEHFSPDFRGYHWWPGYRGCGVYPEHFHHNCCDLPWWYPCSCHHDCHGPKPDEKMNMANQVLAGFSSADSVEELSITNLIPFDPHQLGDYLVENMADEAYLWVVSDCPIEYIESSGFRVPMEVGVMYNGLIHYRSAVKLLKGKMLFVIKFDGHEE